MTGKTSMRALAEKIRKLALRYPETREDHPWGDSAFKVREKAFVFMGGKDDRLGFSVKLPHSRDMALALPFTEPTGYGLGKSGWVSASFVPGDDVPLPLLEDWIDESFRAIAPKKLIAELDGAPATTEKKAKKKTGAGKKAAKTATKKAATRRKRK